MLDDTTQTYEVHPMIAAALAPEPQQPQEAVPSPEEVTNVEIKAEEVPQQPAKQPENFKQLRIQLSSVERERDEAMRRLQELESRSPQPQSNEEDINLKPDDLVEWRHVQKKIQKLEQQIHQGQQQTTQATAEARLKAQYPDFDKVVNTETITMLRDSYPEVAESLNASPDIYKKAVSAYTLIRKLGLYTEDAYQADRATAQKNAAKPRPLTSIAPQQGESPLARANAFANGLTEDLQKQLRKEMEEARKGY